ncbi:MAG: hypothetical protein A3C07_00330 [Candidatus Sungbacteria bacterium RIFCSPHIGHO2_02_FULL_47_11]|uniref:Uncharacterized protein n=1 Tax=Candidatus Sungbacteria bacterium RIFCSPHIGHO2_02_FULL_47_11 TaxID=1802270 RepID=A0A1G2KJT6_9BACT|nr:MAG: hypothetical protein A3C07_00330 [Candidatus Sungbacteria bacterium RIFCSPHIGHO2_02_FULL_47_11]
MLVRIFLVLSVFFVASAVYADFDSERWEFRSAIRDNDVRSKYVILELPSDFFSHLKADLSDFRVVNQGGEVPYVAAVEGEIETRMYIPARFFNLSSVVGQDTTFVVDVGQEGVLHSALTIETTSENFRRNVEIEGSNDQQSWRMLNSGGQVFDFTVRDPRYVKVTINDVSYPEATFRYLRVRILDQGEAPLRINAVKLSRQVSAPAHEVSYSPELAILQNEEDRTTDLVLDLGADGIPNRNARLTTASINFSRAVAVYESSDKKEWHSLGHGYIFSIDTPKFKGSNLSFQYPESNKRYLKLSIINYDDRPIDIGGVTLGGVVRRVLFQRDPAKEYYVYLGNPKARRPQYDIEKISQYVDADQLDRVETGPVEKNSSYIPIKPPLTERSPYVLPLILGLVVVLLAFLLLRLILRTRQTNSL